MISLLNSICFISMAKPHPMQEIKWQRTNYTAESLALKSFKEGEVGVIFLPWQAFCLCVCVCEAIRPVSSRRGSNMSGGSGKDGRSLYIFETKPVLMFMVMQYTYTHLFSRNTSNESHQAPYSAWKLSMPTFINSYPIYHCLMKGTRP